MTRFRTNAARFNDIFGSESTATTPSDMTSARILPHLSAFHLLLLSFLPSQLDAHFSGQVSHARWQALPPSSLSLFHRRECRRLRCLWIRNCQFRHRADFNSVKTFNGALFLSAHCVPVLGKNHVIPSCRLASSRRGFPPLGRTRLIFLCVKCLLLRSCSGKL